MVHFTFILLLFPILNAIATSEYLNLLQPTHEFKRHTLIKPKIYHRREKRQTTPLTATEHQLGENPYIGNLVIEYNENGKNYVLDLTLNRDLLGKDYFHNYQENGTFVMDKLSRMDAELCHYHGKIRDIHNSWAAVSVCQEEISGVIFDGNEMTYLQKATNSSGTGNAFEHLHFLYKQSDWSEMKNRSSTNQEDSIFTESNMQFISKRIKRNVQNQILAEPEYSNKESRYVELLFVVDHGVYINHGRNLRSIYRHCKDIVNIMNAMYKKINIVIALVGVEVWNDRNEINVSQQDSAKVLDEFLQYRRETLIKKFPNDNAHLLTTTVFKDGVVGKAYTKFICTTDKSGGVNVDSSRLVGLVASTVAHEMGHNLGMEHDNLDPAICKCVEKQCIMSARSSSPPAMHWSSCSYDFLQESYVQHLDECLKNKPETLFDGPECGNGFVETGEECDCGAIDECENACCNASTCMLLNEATCASGKCCDLDTCKPKTAGTMCRSAQLECDLPEYCNGISEYCPKDIFKMNGEICGHGKAYCFKGSCKSRNDQCQILWGNTAMSEEDCYTSNISGDRYGNCGYDWINQKFQRCEQKNIMCGMLHCHHLNERLEFGLHSGSIQSKRYIYKGSNAQSCTTILVDDGMGQMNPGMTPNGAPCGEGKMCVNQQCVQVENLKSTENVCPRDCNGNGVCNSLGNCHCKSGFSPPYCDTPGAGGSVDSGPALNLQDLKNFEISMYIIFLGIIPLIAILCIILDTIRRRAKVTNNTLFPSYTNCWRQCYSKGNWTKRFTFSPLATTSPNDKDDSKLDYSNQNVEYKLPHLPKPLYDNKSKLMHPVAANSSRPIISKVQNYENVEIVAVSAANIKPKICIQPPSENIYENVTTCKENKEPKKISRLSLKNIKGLRVNVNFFKNKHDETPSEEPKTSETICSEFDYDDVKPTSVKDLKKQFEKA